SLRAAHVCYERVLTGELIEKPENVSDRRSKNDKVGGPYSRVVDDFQSPRPFQDFGFVDAKHAQFRKRALEGERHRSPDEACADDRYSLHRSFRVTSSRAEPLGR